MVQRESNGDVLQGLDSSQRIPDGMVRRPLTIALIRHSGTPIASASRY
jgi:hypothetical protein